MKIHIYKIFSEDRAPVAKKKSCYQENADANIVDENITI